MKKYTCRVEQGAWPIESIQCQCLLQGNIMGHCILGLAGQ